MALIKDLGRVKGEDGDIYVPNLSVKNGKLYFQWEKVNYDETTGLEPVEIPIPIYYPRKLSNGNVVFNLQNASVAVSTDGTALEPQVNLGNLTGPQGEQGPPGTNRIYHVPNNTDITELSNDERDTNTIYVQGAKAWVYDPALQNTENPFVLIEGIDLSGYAKLSDVYTKQQINNMFGNITEEINTIMSLYDINQ